jgi:hypothetical protein
MAVLLVSVLLMIPMVLMAVTAMNLIVKKR